MQLADRIFIVSKGVFLSYATLKLFENSPAQPGVFVGQQGRTSIQGQALYRALIYGLRAAAVRRLAYETPRCGSVCEADSPDSKCPGCFASLRSEQGAAPLAMPVASIPAHFAAGTIC